MLGYAPLHSGQKYQGLGVVFSLVRDRSSPEVMYSAMKTQLLTKEEGYKARKWVVVDAAGIPLGRLATKVATLLRGKHRTTFTPNVDCGDFVVVINASQVKLTGNKLKGKLYRDYSGYFGGLKETPAGVLLAKKPEDVVRRAVKGMLPSGPLGYSLITKLKVYRGSDHPHKAQQPEQVAALS